MTPSGLVFWRVVAALLHVGVGCAMGMALVDDELRVALALVPLMAASLLVVANRTLGVLLLAAAAAPTTLALAEAVDSESGPLPLGMVCIVCALVALLLVGHLSPRLARFSAGAASIALLLALGLGLATTTAALAPTAALQRSYWRWQGERAALRDGDEGRLRLKAYGRDYDRFAAKAATLYRHGIGVEQIGEWCASAKQSARWAGYNQTAERLIGARYPALLENDLGSRLGGTPEPHAARVRGRACVQAANESLASTY